MSSSEITDEKQKKRPVWTRMLDIILRTAHVAVTSIIFGAAVCGIPFYVVSIWLYLAIATGCALVASEVYHNLHWPYQGRGIMALIHLGLFALIHVIPDYTIQLMTGVIIFGMVGSHMTKKLRYWSIIHRRMMD